MSMQIDNKTARVQFELCDDGQLWTKPRGSKPISNKSALVVFPGGMWHNIKTADIVAALTPKPKRKSKAEDASDTPEG